MSSGYVRRPAIAWDDEPRSQRRNSRRESQPLSAGLMAGAVVAAVVIAACGFFAGRLTARNAPASTGSTATSAGRTPAAGGSTAAAPDTAAGARAAAEHFFALYAAEQYSAAYPLLDSATRAMVPEHKWVRVHEACKSSASGLSYAVGRPVLAGKTTAVMSVSLSGVASKLGSEEQSFAYQDGGWYWAPSASDLSSAGNYKGSVAQIVARLKAAGECG